MGRGSDRPGRLGGCGMGVERWGGETQSERGRYGGAGRTGLDIGTGLWGGDSGETGENCDTSKTAKAMRRGKNLGDKNWSMSSSR